MCVVSEFRELWLPSCVNWYWLHCDCVSKPKKKSIRRSRPMSGFEGRVSKLGVCLRMELMEALKEFVSQLNHIYGCLKLIFPIKSEMS